MKEFKRYPRETINNENGMILVTSLVMISVLLLLGATAVVMSTTDIKISANYRAGVQAFYAAEAGIYEAKNRLQGLSTAANYAGDPAATPNPVWSAYIQAPNALPIASDTDRNASYQNIAFASLQANIPYLVSIKHKREYDAELAGHTVAAFHYLDQDGSTATHTAAAPGNLIYWGYGNAATPATAIQFTSAAAPGVRPVEIITVYGKSGTALRKIRAEVVHNPGPVIAAAIYAKGDVTGNGGAMVVNGADSCGVAAAKPSTYTLDPSVTNPNGGPTLTPAPQHGTMNVDVTGYVNSLSASATVSITADINGASYGNATNFVTVYSDTANPNNVQGLKMQNVTGYGTLLVKGDLELGGGFTWNGLVLCTGVLTFNGGGAGVNIRGAVLANETVAINGGLNISYDSCMVDKALSTQSLQVITWREIY